MNRVTLLAISLMATLLPVTSSAFEAGKVQINGFVSQGYMKSQKNNFLDPGSSNGTFQINEIGLTFYLPAADFLASDKPKISNHTLIEGKGRILIMDDIESLRDVMTDMLETFGFDVVSCSDGVGAIREYRAAMSSPRPFQLVILDLTVPGSIGGKETIKCLLDIDPSIKAIVTSGYSDDLVLSKYREFGFSGCLQKPFNISDLSDTLKAALA